MLKVVVPSYNCEDWIIRCLESIAMQEYQNYAVVIIDDASTDSNYHQIHDFVFENMPTSAIVQNWYITRNQVNQKCPLNIINGIRTLQPSPEDVIVLVDGDDFLPHPQVFDRIAYAYVDPEVWLTYGNYEPWPHNTGQVLAEAYSKEEIEQRDFRTRILFNHLITFKAFLWNEVPKRALQDDRGQWFKVGYDRAMMIPMLEMAAERHLFIDECLYMYNAINPLSDVHVRVEEAQKVHKIIHSRPKYDRLEFW